MSLPELELDLLGELGPVSLWRDGECVERLRDLGSKLRTLDPRGLKSASVDADPVAGGLVLARGDGQQPDIA
jgi:hypothetical protein